MRFMAKLFITKNTKRVFRIGGFAPSVVTGKGLAELIGKAVFLQSGDQKIAAKVDRIAANGDIVVKLAVPGRDGILRISETELTVKASDTEVVDALMSNQKIRAFEAGAAIELSKDNKAVTLYEKDENGKDTKIVCDYRDVSIDGHASTFGTPDDRDRGGDYVMKGAWDNTLIEFRQNPVMLVNHENRVESLVGSWSRVSVDGMGLGVTGNVTNAPGAKDTRFKLVEGHLKGISIGGIWYYIEDGFGIEDIALFEISLVAVPMNPKALVYTSSVGPAECQKAFAKFWRSHTALRAA